MEVVSEVDVICRQVISKVAVKELETVATKFLDREVGKQSEKNLKEFPALSGVDERMDHPATDSMKSFNLFRELLKKCIYKMPDGEIKDNLRALRVETKDYRKQVIDVRNVLGHALETENERGWLILDRDSKPFMTVADFPSYRSNFLRNLRAIRKISSVLLDEE